MNNTVAHNSLNIELENSRFMSGVYRWMTMGILLTAVISFFVGNSHSMVEAILTNKILFYGLLIGEIGLVIFLSAAINKLSALSATLIYLFYSALNGVTLSVIFLIYTQDSIFSVFLTTAVAFGGLSAFGYVTKKDLGPIGTFCTMGLWGLIGFGLLSFFFPSLMSARTSWVYNVIGLIIFSGLTAYDNQKIKNSNIIGNEGTEEDQKETILGALTLYLDFINLFLFLLRLMGGRRR
ncbi:MAG: Bax inhibitor-1/YccA family protein [Bdellovibrionota bacterium]|nr:Bax inhibitor-1/YccA family protein [Bdellovibrionota bacterium]